MLDYDIDPDNVHVGPSDYVPWLLRPQVVLHPHGRHAPSATCRSTSSSSSKSGTAPTRAGVVIDAVRCAKLGLDRGLSGTLVAPSAYFMKSPPVQHPDDECRELTEQFISGEGRGATAVCQG